MLFRWTRLWVALGLLAAIWALSAMRGGGDRYWLRPVGTPPGPVKILQFYASVGMLTAGQTALLCYGVENAKSIQISPSIQGVYPALSRCVEILPEHTTHYMMMAEGFDGQVATRSFTLPVQDVAPNPQIFRYARGDSQPQSSQLD